ncbi:hypothetical protein PEL8287_02992 [Roseovarius litorisediminis]|uniref:Uncharacterized protein n=1 Tax=Roseovarius litorisediminis TaxID=1312363 RepID=A0A1Y5T7R8_9RHOB|nr:hypothetical protein [Roseovarius litorisediminis]SLN55890.1 hypothetical protein PEL8287_02992 [Roseovarius litorisediminis]
MIIGILILAIASGSLAGGVMLYLGASFWMVLAVYSLAGTALILGAVAMSALCDQIRQNDSSETNAELNLVQLSKGR